MPQAPIKHTPPPPPERSKQKTDNKPHRDSYFASVSTGFRAAKYITVILLVIFLIFSFTFLRKDITLENLRYLLKFISFTNTETSITAAKINYASGDPNRLDLFIGDLCTLSPEGYALYDSHGNQIMAESINYGSPVLKVSERYALCYDMNGNAYTILNTYSKLYEGTSEYPITDADISDTGSFAVASSSREYRTAITLYDEDFSPTSRILKNDHLMAMELSPDGKLLALMTSAVSDGRFRTRVELIAVGKDSAQATCELEGLGYSINLTENGYIALTDEAVCFLDDKLQPKRVYKHTASLVMTDASEKYYALAYADGIIGNSYNAFIYDSEGTKLYEGKLNGKLIAIESDKSGDHTFFLSGTTVTRINLINKKISKIEVLPDAIDLLVEDNATVLAAMKNYALTYSFAGVDEHYYERPAADAATSETSGAAETEKETAEETQVAPSAVPAETAAASDPDQPFSQTPLSSDDTAAPDESGTADTAGS